MSKSDDLKTGDSKEQTLYELGQFGMHEILKNLHSQGLYEQPLIIGMLDSLLAATFKRIGNDQISETVVRNITAKYANLNITKH